MRKRHGLYLSASLVLMAAASAAQAQSTIEELVVTAEKRAQNLQDVPVAISAYTSETRDKLGILSVQDLTYFTPGMQYSNSQDRVTVRGIGRLTDNLATEGGVAIYYDGIYTSSTAEAARSPLFVERTEILRGPQGTLYGRNSIGGAINVISRRPAKEFGGEVRATIGSFDRTEFEGIVSVPVADNLRFMFGASKIDQEEGYYRNYSGLPEEGGIIDAVYYEFQAQAELGENLEAWLRYSFQKSEGRPRFTTTNANYDTSSPVSNLFTVPQSAYGFNLPHTQIGTFTTNPGVNDLRGFNTDTTSKALLKDYHTLTADLTYHASGFDVRYLGGYRTFYYETIGDFDNTPVTSFVYPSTCVTQTPACLNNFDARFQGITIFPSYVLNFITDKQWWSHELNISSTTDGPFQWIVGAYAYGEDLYQALHIPSPNQPQFATNVRQRDALDAFTATTPSLYNNSRRDVYYVDQSLKNWSNAVFAQADYEISDAWKVTGGIRYTKDIKKAKEQSFQTCWAFPAFICSGAGTINPNGTLTATPAQQAINNSPVDWQGTFLVPNEALTLPHEDGVLTLAFRDPRTHLITRYLGKEWSAVTGTLGVDWTPNDDTLVYAKYSKGYKAGGFNSGAGSQAFPTTKEEKVDAFEVGAKLNFGSSLQVNSSIFYYDYSNLQTPVFIIPPGGGPGQTQFFNVPKSTSKGVEIEGIWRPIENLTLIANYSYLDAVIEEACCFVDTQDPQARQPGAKPDRAVGGGALTGAQIGQDMSGQTLPNSPNHKAVFNANYTFNVGPGDLTLSGTYAWKGETYHSIFNRSYNLADSYGVLDLRATWTDANDRYSVVGYVRNATDEVVIDIVGAGALDNLNNPQQTLTILDPRTYGVQFQYRF